MKSAEQHAADDGATRVRAVADEIAAVLADATRRWHAAMTACEARRWNEAAEQLEQLLRTRPTFPDRGARTSTTC